jgi:hypothetical protein
MIRFCVTEGSTPPEFSLIRVLPASQDGDDVVKTFLRSLLCLELGMLLTTFVVVILLGPCFQLNLKRRCAKRT